MNILLYFQRGNLPKCDNVRSHIILAYGKQVTGNQTHVRKLN